jgi:hypothetical protein
MKNTIVTSFAFFLALATPAVARDFTVYYDDTEPVNVRCIVQAFASKPHNIVARCGIKNTSDQNVTAVRIALFQVDQFGEPSDELGSSAVFTGSYAPEITVILTPFTYFDTQGVESSNDFQCVVTNVKFADGTTWKRHSASASPKPKATGENPF